MPNAIVTLALALALLAGCSGAGCFSDGDLPEGATPLVPERHAWTTEPSVGVRGDDPEYAAEVKRALRTWGYGRYVEGGCDGADICFTTDQPSDGALLGEATFEEGGVCNIRSRWHGELIVLHELGHCLGLAHSEDPNSIMFPGLQIFVQQRITEGDMTTLDYIKADASATCELGTDDVEQ